MSKIFDALKRSEGERAGSESTALPQAPELLREAERRVSSNWEAVVSIKEPEPNVIAEEHKILKSQALPKTAMNAVAPLPPSHVGSGDRPDILNQFPTLPVSVGEESHLACVTDWKSPMAEAVRLLAVRLRDIRRSRTLKKVVITSTIPREGKSTISSNLACVLARRADEKVLLIGGDVRLPALSRTFGITRQEGLCDLLREERKLTECVYHLPDVGIWILPAGVSTSNPLELLQSRKLSTVMEQLCAHFDWIIIDSPPVLPLADTSIWMRLADGVLLVAREGITEKRQLKKGLEALESTKVLGAILNGTKASRYSAYYYGNSD